MVRMSRGQFEVMKLKFINDAKLAKVLSLASGPETSEIEQLSFTCTVYRVLDR
jgi:hypothetical protein